MFILWDYIVATSADYFCKNLINEKCIQRAASHAFKVWIFTRVFITEDVNGKKSSVISGILGKMQNFC